MNSIKFKQFYVTKSIKERFIKPMISWNEFFKVGLYDIEKYKIIEGAIKYELTSMNHHKIIFESKDEFEVITHKAVFIDKYSTIAKIEANEINPRKAYQFLIILNTQERTIDIPTATNADAELVFTFIQNKIFNLNETHSNIENLLKSKLDNIKSLYENGDITKEEYEIKRKQIIDNY
jgi:hypothetical protein